MQDSSGLAERLVGIEVGSSGTIVVALAPGGELTDSFSVPLKEGEGGVSRIGRAVAEAHERFGEQFSLGIAVPGLLNKRTGMVEFSTLIPEHENIDLANELKHFTDLPIVFENDANAAAYGELKLGAGRGSIDLFYVTLGAGVGGALILGGELWRGASGFAGEFGYVAINSEGMKLEDVASSDNIIRRTKNWFHQDPTSSLNVVGEENITLADVVKAAEEDDDFAQLMLQRTGTYVGTALAGVINLLNIEKIVIGGEIMQAKHLVLNAILQRAKELSFGPGFEAVEIVEGELGDKAAATGAALLAAERQTG